MADSKLFLDDTWFQTLTTTGINTNVIVTYPLTYVYTPTGGVDGRVVVTLQGVPLTEVAYSAIDVTDNIGKYAVAVDGTVNFIVAKSINTVQEAKDYLQGLLVTYVMRTLSYYETTPNLYTLLTETSDGVVVGNTNASQLSEILARIQVLDFNLNINTVGYYKHTLIHAITNP